MLAVLYYIVCDDIKKLYRTVSVGHRSSICDLLYINNELVKNKNNTLCQCNATINNNHGLYYYHDVYNNILQLLDAIRKTNIKRTVLSTAPVSPRILNLDLYL